MNMAFTPANRVKANKRVKDWAAFIPKLRSNTKLPTSTRPANSLMGALYKNTAVKAMYKTVTIAVPVNTARGKLRLGSFKFPTM